MMITVGGHEYSTLSRMDAFAQLQLARKLGPALPIIEGLVSVQNAEKDKSLLTILMLSHISDEDTKFVITKCLSVVGRHEGGKVAKIQTPSGELMYDDIGLSEMLQLAMAVVEENLGDFFRTSLAALEQEKEKPN